MPKVCRRGGHAGALVWLARPLKVVFRCGKIRRVKDEKGRREWARKERMRWDSWDAVASKKWGNRAVSMMRADQS